MKYSDLIEKLQKLGIRMSKRALQQYASPRFRLVDEPIVRERGGPAEFTPDALAEVYAAYHLLHKDKIPYGLIRQARQIGRYLETTDYNHLQDIRNDIGIRALIYRRPKETFYAFEWLWLKYSVLPERELPLDERGDIRGILIQWAEMEDDEIEALLSGEDREVESLSADEKAILQDRQRKGKAIETALEINREARRIRREQGEEAMHRYLRGIRAKGQS